MEIINICYDKNFTSEGLSNCDIRQIDSIPNFSAHKIIMSFLNQLEKKQSLSIIQSLCRKLRQGGTLTFNLLDFDQLVNFYQNQKIKLDDVIIHTNGIQSFISRSEVIKMFHKNSEISLDSILYDDIYSICTVSRKSL